ncbi:hypothetical protein V1520DRAFT_336484 [Lipomyces starkeyi]|uniref:PX domain-containing protein n=1 Tax=Lipomyces starkeyi NRRL Y-11557 TaxID=675824 RepID=A0A1E3QDM9_LIPST|nr:hypothetical protein LIPSTDRAFT_217403 [Lipomyces starkeyi NRRL Y-11557]
MSEVDITIRSYSTSPAPKPHTVYHVQIRLPLRSYTVMKRFSDFVKLASDMENVVGESIPFKLPRKQLFGNSVRNMELIEERKAVLEKFLRDIQKSSDQRWRLSDPWRDFLGLSAAGRANQGSSLLSSSSSTASLVMPSGKHISDPVVWLDTLHEVKTLLHEARKYLSDRDTLSGTGSVNKNGVLESLSAAAEAKKCLVQSGTKIVMLDRGLKELASSIGQGELRRRGDMLNLVKKEREGLESLASTVSRHTDDTSSAASESPDRAALFAGSKSVLGNVASSAKRVLGPLAETGETRQLDNRGLLTLQMQKMQSQDDTLLEFSKILARQKQLGIDINDELELQNEMLRMLEDDVENSDGKLRRADRQLKKIK